MTKLNPKEKELWRRIALILWKDWDPIGVYEDNSECDDEYDSYVPYLFRLAIEGKGEYRIASSLTSTIDQSIGLSASNNNEHDLKVAKLIVDAKEQIIG